MGRDSPEHRGMTRGGSRRSRDRDLSRDRARGRHREHSRDRARRRDRSRSRDRGPGGSNGRHRSRDCGRSRSHSRPRRHDAGAPREIGRSRASLSPGRGPRHERTSPARRAYRDDRERLVSYAERSRAYPGGLDAMAVPDVGSIHRARVHGVRPFGVFVALEGFQRHGLVHSSQVAEDVAFSREDDDDVKVKALEFFAPSGSQVWVKVTEVRPGDGGPPKIECSLRAVDQDSGADLDPNNTLAARRGPGPRAGSGPVSDSPPEAGAMLQGVVASVKPYGLFVRLDGFRANGLVHASQVSSYLDLGAEESDEAKCAALAEVHPVGDRVWVKVLEVKEGEDGRGPKVACSIKLAGQGDGADLDPHNLQWTARGEGGRGPRAPRAVAEVEPDGRIDWGHLAADVRGRGSGGYDLIAADPQLDVAPHAAVAGPGPNSMNGGDGGPGAPLGRGRDMVRPAWMSDEPAAAPGAPGAAGLAPTVTTIEEALAVLAKHRKKHKKDKEKHKKEKGKKAKDKKAKKAKEDAKRSNDWHE